MEAIWLFDYLLYYMNNEYALQGGQLYNQSQIQSASL